MIILLSVFLNGAELLDNMPNFDAVIGRIKKALATDRRPDPTNGDVAKALNMYETNFYKAKKEDELPFFAVVQLGVFAKVVASRDYRLAVYDDDLIVHYSMPCIYLYLAAAFANFLEFWAILVCSIQYQKQPLTACICLY